MLNYEEDVAAYIVKAATDERVFIRVIIYKPPGNITTQLELISSWPGEEDRKDPQKEEIIKLSESKMLYYFTSLFFLTIFSEI